MTKADIWLENIEKELKNAKKNGEISPRIIELVSELRIYQAELEMQNEELKQSQEELSQLYNQYYELYNGAPLGYFTLDKDGIIRDVNTKCVKLLQLNKNQIIGRGFSQFIPKVDENKYFYALSKALQSESIQKLELQLKKKNTHFYAHMEIMPSYERDDESYRIVITNITEYKKSETIEERLACVSYQPGNGRRTILSRVLIIFFPFSVCVRKE